MSEPHTLAERADAAWAVLEVWVPDSEQYRYNLRAAVRLEIAAAIAQSESEHGVAKEEGVD